MKPTEIMRALGVSQNVWNLALSKACKIKPELLAKKQPHISNDYTLDECILIVSQMTGSELMVEYIKENFIEHIDEGFNINGTRDFVDRWNEGKRPKCCNTCKFCMGKVPESKSIPYPFCTVYNRYLHNFNARVYEDWCNSYLFEETEKPRMWLKENAPTNINLYGETDKVNGIKRSEFKSSEETKRGAPIVILGKVGFDY